MIAVLDSSALIYYFEGTPPYRNAVTQALTAIKQLDASAQVAVSRLGVMECRVKPLREGNTDLLKRYDSFFGRVHIVELTASVVGIATQLRADLSMKTLDSLQAACALSLGADACFVTGDSAFTRVPGLKVRHLVADLEWLVQ